MLPTPSTPTETPTPTPLGPTISFITPNSGNGTLATTINGTNFLTGAIVNLTRSGQANITATSVTVIPGNQINCTLPLTEAAVGSWNVVVTNFDGQSATLVGGFTITPSPPSAPTITSINPNSGNGNLPIIITGTNFSAGSTVNLTRKDQENITATGVTVLTGSQVNRPNALNGTKNLNPVPNGQDYIIETSVIRFSASHIRGIFPRNGLNTVNFFRTGQIRDNATSVAASTSTMITCTLPLDGAKTGLWNAVVTTPDGQSGTMTNGFTIVKRPVVLVHGYTSNPLICWNDLKKALEENGFTPWILDYELFNIQDPKTVSKQLDAFIAQKKEETKYSGKIDIVCHSMGALVSRWYMEKGTDENGIDHPAYKNVNQWIGIAPVTTGSSAADRGKDSSILSFFVKYVRGEIWYGQVDNAFAQLQTYSNTTLELADNYERNQGKFSDVIYRVIVGYNPTKEPNFYRYEIPGQNGMTRDGENLNYYSTYNGDGMVSNDHSKIPGAGLDILPKKGSDSKKEATLYDHHNLPHNPETIELVLNYLKNPNLQKNFDSRPKVTEPDIGILELFWGEIVNSVTPSITQKVKGNCVVRGNKNPAADSIFGEGENLSKGL